MMRDTAATIGIAKRRRSAILVRREVRAEVHPLILFPLHTGSISVRVILNPGQVILVFAASALSQGFSAA
jgi:hypothetical protein